MLLKRTARKRTRHAFCQRVLRFYVSVLRALFKVAENTTFYDILGVSFLFFSLCPNTIFFCLGVILYCQMKRLPDKRSNPEPCYCYYNNCLKVAVCINIIRQKLLPNISTFQERAYGTPDGVYRASTRSNPKFK